MKLSALSVGEAANHLASKKGLILHLGAFVISLRTKIPSVIRNLHLLYGEYSVFPENEIIDFRIEVDKPISVRRWFRPQVIFKCDEHQPFKPLPLDQSFAMFEWGLNWVIANHCHQFAIVHSSVVEKGGYSLIFPGSPGSGKSTLCAALVCRGWRLMSDEMALISLNDGFVYAFPRPISLKNQSIEIIENFGTDLVFGDIAKDTAKGTVAHMKPPAESLGMMTIPAPPRAIVFPQYLPDAKPEFLTISPGQTMMKLAENCFNYPVLGTDGFSRLVSIAANCPSYKYTYSDLNEAITALDQLLEQI